MPRLRERDWNLQGCPTHPQIPTQKFVRYNLDFPPNYVSGKNIYKQYPFKCTPSGKRSSVVAEPELTDFEYSLTAQEYKDILNSYGYHLRMYLLGGKTYKFPEWRLGTIKLVRRKRRAINHILSAKHKKDVMWYLPHQNGYKLNNKWDKKFKFNRIWHMTFPGIYDLLNKNIQMMHNLSKK